METVLTVLHVLAAVFIVGPMAILPMTAMRALRSGDRSQVAALARTTNIVNLASLLVVVFGFGALGMSDPKYDLSVTTPWILLSLLCYVAALGLSVAMVVPALRAAARVPAGGVTGEGGSVESGYSRIMALSGVVSLLLVVAVILMVWKP